MIAVFLGTMCYLCVEGEPYIYRDWYTTAIHNSGMKIETMTDLGGLDLSPQESTKHHMCGHTAISSYVSDPSLPERRRTGIVHIVGPGSQSCRPKLLSDPEKVALYDSKVPLLLSKRCSHSLLVLPHEFALFTGQSYVVMLRSKLLLYRPRGLLVQRRSMDCSTL